MEPATVVCALSALRDPLLDNVLYWSIRVGADWAEDPAVWVYVVLKPEAEPSRIRSLVLRALRKTLPTDVTPYVRFKNLSQIEAVPV